MLHGGSAQDGWRRLARRHPGLAAGFEVIPTYHTSNQAFIGTPEVRAQRTADLASAFGHATRMLQEAMPPDCHPVPVTRCEICHRTVAYRPGSLSEVLTEHFRRAYPKALGIPSR